MRNLNNFITRELGISPSIKKVVDDKLIKYYILSNNKLIGEYENNVYNINGLDLYMKLYLVFDYLKLKSGRYMQRGMTDTSFNLFNKNGYIGVITLENNFYDINFVSQKFNINENFSFENDSHTKILDTLVIFLETFIGK